MKVGLALGGGGLKGLSHIGVIKALEENNIPIDLIAGTSAGSLIGSLYSYFNSIEKVEIITQSLTKKSLFGILSDINFIKGFIGKKSAESFLKQVLKDQKIENLNIPFSAIATDLATGSPIIMDSGEVVPAVNASCAIPGIFEPVLLYGKYLIDGGICLPVPVSVTKKMGADFVIAVNLSTFYFPKIDPMLSKKPTIMQTALTALGMLIHNLAEKNCMDADFVIKPDTDIVSTVEYIDSTDRDVIIKIGYEATKKIIPLLKEKLEKFSK